MKRILVYVILGLMLLCLFSSTALASKDSALIQASLSFNGTTANCYANIAENGQKITATMELWQGNTKLATWTDNGTSFLTLQESYPVQKGVTYTLKIYGTSGSNPINATRIATC